MCQMHTSNNDGSACASVIHFYILILQGEFSVYVDDAISERCLQFKLQTSIDKCS